MKATTRVMVASALAACSAAAGAADERAVSYAVEDAARQTVSKLAEDARVKPLKSIAFVRLNLPDSQDELALGSNLSQVFEVTLAAKPQSYALVTHATHAEEWKLIDGVFDQAADFESYDPKTHPALSKLKLADALLLGQVIDAREEKEADANRTSVRIAMRLIRISTGEQLWGQVIEGCHVVSVDRVKDIRNKARSLLTFQNALYALGGLVGLILLLVALRQMIRVR